MSANIVQPASRAGLVLTPTVDKNGRQTHVWRKPNDLANSQLSRIAFAPSTVSAAQFYSLGFDPRSVKTSPWGKITNMEEIHPGVYIVEAEDGKGAFLSPARQEEIDPRWNVGEDGFFSNENAGWAVIPYTFPEEFGEEASRQAEDYLRDYRPHEYMDITGEIVLEEDSVVLSGEAFDKAHEGEFAATSMEDGVLPDEVIVTASRIGDDGEDAEFIVSRKEIEDDGELPKGHRKLIDEEKHPRTNDEIEALKRELKEAIKLALVSRYPRSRYLISTYYVTKATLKGANKVRSEDDEDENISKDWGLRGAMGGFMSQLITEISNSPKYPRDVDAEYAREVRRYHRRQRTRGWVAKIVG